MDWMDRFPRRHPRLPRSLSGRAVALVATLAFALGIPLGIAVAAHQFGDVPSSNPFHKDIAAIAEAGVTSGCGGGNYCPKSAVTREQMAAFMNRLGALSADKVPVVNADKLDGLDSNAFARPLFAVVNSDGSLARGLGVTSQERLGTGWYEVGFNRDVTSCAFLATVGQPGTGAADPAFISTALRAGTTNAVFVERRSPGQALADGPFHLQVICPNLITTVVFGEVQQPARGGSGANEP